MLLGLEGRISFSIRSGGDIMLLFSLAYCSLINRFMEIVRAVPASGWDKLDHLIAGIKSG